MPPPHPAQAQVTSRISSAVVELDEQEKIEQQRAFGEKPERDGASNRFAGVVSGLAGMVPASKATNVPPAVGTRGGPYVPVAIRTGLRCRR